MFRANGQKALTPLLVPSLKKNFSRQITFIQSRLVHKSKRSGFTLIELLVVIAIIGLLASVVLVSLNSARSKARDAKRIADLQQIAKAAELFYDSQN